MRVRTNERRNAIVGAAWEVFKENGFERTTMSDISVRGGVSKQTLYSYFDSKDELFKAALEYVLQEASQEAVKLLAATGPLPSRLLRFARLHMKTRLLPDMVAVDRILIAEAERSHVFEMLRSKSMLKRQQIAEVLKTEMSQGRLRRADPIRAAIQLLALVEFDVRDRHLWGDKSVTPQMIDEQVRHGVDSFLRAYAPE